ncbi:hypothetical protein FOG51_01480 [Hanseniaspora uvarum]|nr:hypothetical protein FOG48_03996 [Hanseniaspora uvarum]KAF0273909.1 hypothetical protein FOG51_01480 [Hanseniaspora uvarum]KAF0277479.1 hypothetical protein FOG50_01634 [Hanseniaspora uvarum]KKA02907.1 Serine/threonine-protein kinase HuKIN28 [Hanseniaspora uvarum DSM 2768]
MDTSEYYTKEKKLGEGTFAIVYLGKKKSSNESNKALPDQVAIKEIKLDLMKKQSSDVDNGDVTGIDISAIREIKYLQELRQHANIIKLFDVYTDTTNSINLVLEFLPMDLEKLIKKKTIIFNSMDLKLIVLQMLRGVNHLHRLSIMHRDLKPANLLIGNDGMIKIADFGLARIYDDGGINAHSNMTNNVVTRWYKAPELLLGSKNYDFKIDIWSLGLIIIELLIRVPYLPGKDDMDQLTLMFKVMGTPTEKDWLHVKALPNYNTNLYMYPKPNRQEWRKRFVAISDNFLDLLINMLEMSPKSRWNVVQCLESEYIREFPRPSDPLDLVALMKE